jgi:hypothetical protein
MIDKRIQFRRYEDRRMALLLAIHEILFERDPGPDRETAILAAIVANYRVDLAAFVDLSEFEKAGRCDIVVRVGEWHSSAPVIVARGDGLTRLMALHDAVEGALTFESVRKPDAFASDWDSLWAEGIGVTARALLSIPLKPKKAPWRLMWLLQVQSSREWSSRDRDLAEEVTELLVRAADKGA